jgi:hypothetical protein
VRARLSAGLVIWVATSRARLAYCGVRIKRRSVTSDSAFGSEICCATTTFKHSMPAAQSG